MSKKTTAGDGDDKIVRLDDVRAEAAQAAWDAAVDEMVEAFKFKTIKRTGEQKLIPNVSNVSKALALHPALRDLFRLDAFAQTYSLQLPVPGTQEADDLAAYEPRPLKDTDTTEIQIWLQDNIDGLAEIGLDKVEQAVRLACSRNAVDPLHDWAKWCAENWDEEPRLHLFHRNYVKAETWDKYAEELGIVSLLGVVCRILDPGARHRTVPVWQGSQGIGKSAGLAALCPRPEWFTDTLPDKLNDKDAAAVVIRMLIVELGEMTAMRKSEANELKSFLTRTSETFRPHYGKLPITAPRRCMFFGTTNDDAYLRDPTGHTRFYPIKIDSIDVEAIARDRDQLIGEAVHMMREITTDNESGEDERPWWHLSEEATAILEHNRAEAEVQDPWFGDVARFVDGLVEVCPGQIMDAKSHVMTSRDDGYNVGPQRNGLGLSPAQRTSHNQARIETALKALGWRKDGSKMSRASGHRGRAKWLPPKEPI